MAKYTTGELANLCGVSVRTVQYYDTRGILVPSELSEGGRRIYSDEDLRRMKIICFLRELDVPIESIKELLLEEHPEKVIALLIDEQQRLTEEEISKLRQKSEKLDDLRQSIGRLEKFSVDSIADIAYIISNKKKLKKLRALILCIGVVMDIIEVLTLVIWINTGNWVPFALGMPIVVLLGILVSVAYYRGTVYICPECHKVFKPKFGEMLWASHTPNTRKLKCPVCKYKGFCVETYGKALSVANKE